MTQLKKWEEEERGLVKKFEDDALKLNLAGTANEKALVNLIKDTHEQISKLDAEYASFLVEKFAIEVVITPEHRPPNIIKLKIPALTEQQDVRENIAFLNEHFGEEEGL